MSFVRLLEEQWKRLSKYYNDPWKWLKIIYGIVREYDPSAKVLVFGSFVKNCMKPDSDIDVLIITDKASDINFRLKLYVRIAEAIGEPHPFELHVVTWEEYEKWYKKFLDKVVEVRL